MRVLLSSGKYVGSFVVFAFLVGSRAHFYDTSVPGYTEVV